MQQEIITKIKPTERIDAAIIFPKYNQKWLLCKKKETWEFPGGHIENDETLLEGAKRELYEETGAVAQTLNVVCYFVRHSDSATENIGVFFASIDKIYKLPKSEMEEVCLFDKLPENLSYPETYSKLLPEILKYLEQNN